MMTVRSRAGSVWIFQLRFDSIQFSISSIRFPQNHGFGFKTNPALARSPQQERIFKNNCSMFSQAGCHSCCQANRVSTEGNTNAPKNEYSVHITCKYCATFLCIVCKFCTLFQAIFYFKITSGIAVQPCLPN